MIIILYSCRQSMQLSIIQLKWLCKKKLNNRQNLTIETFLSLSKKIYNFKNKKKNLTKILK
jgi:hypothetical protein